MPDDLDIALMWEPEPGWELVDTCPICAGVPVQFTVYQTPITKILIGQATLALRTPVTWSECPDCETQFQKLRLTPDTLYEYYKSDQYRKLINRDNEEYRDENTLIYAKHVMHFMEEVGITATRQLDYGSGTGALLRTVPWEGVGVEISENATKWSRDRGCEIYETLGEVEGKFDLITIIETLEHLSNPVATLRTLLGYLEPDGHILIAVPWGGEHSGDKNQIGHLFSFNRRSMEVTARIAGIRGLSIAKVLYSETGVALFYLGVKDGG